MISIYDTADWFIKKEPMTEIKCQILCYYAQAWSLAIDDKKMFNANFRAGIYGPVNEELRSDIIIITQDSFELIPENTLSEKAKSINDPDTIELLEEVWRVYGKYDRFELGSIVCDEIPYERAHAGYKDIEYCPNNISEAIMKIFYRALNEINETETKEKTESCS